VQAVGAAEASRAEAVGLAEAKAAEALGLARAEGFEKQKEALGAAATAIVAAINAIAEGGVDVMPNVLVTGGGSSLDGLAATLIQRLGLGDGALSSSLASALPAPAGESAEQ
jgi:Tfp pilus assembly PilM family ATPase